LEPDAIVGSVRTISGGDETVPEGPTLRWLLDERQPAARYQTMVGLLGLPHTNPKVRVTLSEIPRRGWAADILKRQHPEGYWGSAKNLYRPKYTATNWMALVLSDLGMTRDDPRIARTADLFFRYWMDEGKENIFGDEVCIVGNTARFMTRFGYYEDRRVRRLFGRLLDDQKRDGGWHCRNSASGTLDCWEALAAFSAIPESGRTREIRSAIERGAEFYLQRKLFEEGNVRYRPWFRLHYPVHYYYDILVGLDVLTSLGFGGDRRLKPALDILYGKRTDGRWSLDRTHPDPPGYAWGKHNLRHKTNPFALEKPGRPSKWVTLRALKVQKRVAEAS